MITLHRRLVLAAAGAFVAGPALAKEPDMSRLYPVLERSEEHTSELQSH